MLDSLFDFYRKNITTYRLVFQFMRTWHILMQVFFLSFLISVYVLISGLCVFLLIQEPIVLKIGLFGFIGSVLFFAFSTWRLNAKAKRVLEHEHGIRSIAGMWRTPEFETLQADLLKDYLQEHHLYTDEKLKLLIEGYENETRKNKYPTLINWGIVISLSLPLWIQYVTFIFKAESMKTLEDATWVLMVGVLFVMVVIAMIGFTKWFFGEFQDAFLFGEKAHRKTLIERLQDARLRYRKEADKTDDEKRLTRKVARDMRPRYSQRRRN